MNKALDRLIAAARKAYATAPQSGEEDRFCASPLGFGTRVAALWGKSKPDTAMLFERWAWRGLAFALAICAVTAIAHETIASSEQDSYAEVIALPGSDLF